MAERSEQLTWKRLEEAGWENPRHCGGCGEKLVHPKTLTLWIDETARRVYHFDHHPLRAAA